MNLENPKKILIIDNDLVIRYTLKKIFSNYLIGKTKNENRKTKQEQEQGQAQGQGQGIKIYTSSDGLQGLGYVYVVRPDVIIIDTTLPKYSGRELTEYIRTNATLKNTPVILLNEGTEKLENLAENFIQVSKSDEEFPSNLIEIVKKVLNAKYKVLNKDTSQENTKLQIPNSKLEEISVQRPESSVHQRLVNFLAKKVLRYSNISDVESQKVLSRNIFIKSIYYIKYLFDQFLTSVYLTFFYIFVGKKDYEETIDQKQKDIERFRVRTFPALAFGLAVILFGVIQFFMLSGVFVALTYVATAPAYAASYTWDGGGTDGTCGGQAGDGNKWSCAANWSSDIVPTAADSVTFNSTSTKDSTIDASFGGTITSLTMATGYSGTITVSRSFTMSSSFSQATGTFNGSNQTITDSGTYSLTGGTFTSTSGTLSVASTFTISSGVFNHNNGTVSFGGDTATLTCNNVGFNAISFAGQINTKTVSSNCTLPIGNNPTIPNGITLNGTLSGSGTITNTTGTTKLNSGGVLSGFSGLTGTSNGLTIAGATADFSSYTTFVLAGTLAISAGTITLPTGADLNMALIISGGTFNAPSGNMTLARDLTISGTPIFNANGGTITFDGSVTSTLACNNVTFNLVSINAPGGVKTVSTSCSLPLGSNPTVTVATLLLDGTFSGTGTLTVSGNLTLNNPASALTGFGGINILSAFVIQNGSGANPNLNLSSYTTSIFNTILVGTGTLTLPNNTAITGSLTITGGTFNAPSGIVSVGGAFSISGTPVFNANGGTFIFNSGSSVTLSCNNVTFSLVQFAHPSGAKTVSSNCSLPLGNNPTIGSGATPQMILNGTLTGTGTFTTIGQFTLNSGAALTGFTGFAGGSASGVSLVVSGATADFSSYSSFTLAGSLTLNSGSLTVPSGSSIASGNGITMSGGTFTANGNFSNTGGIALSGGTFNAPSGNMTLAGALTISGSPTFNHNSGTVTFDGSTATLSCNSVSFNLVSFTGQTGVKTVSSNCNLPLGNNPTIPNGITLSGTLSGTGTITNTTGAFILATGATLTGFTGYTGTSNILVVGGATANFSSFTTFMVPGTVTLSSGTLTLPSGADLNSTLTISGGTFNAPSGNMTLANNLTISGSAVFNHNNGTFTFDGAGGTLSCNNVTFNLVSFTGQTGQKVVNSNCTLPLGNNPTVPHNIILNGTFSGTGLLTTTTAASTTITLNAGATFSGFSGFSAVNVTYSGATMNWSSYSSVVITSNFNLSSGTLALSNTSNTLAAIVVTGATVSQGAGSLSVSVGVVISSGSLTLAPNADLNGSLTISGGTFNAPNGNMTLAGALTISGSPTFNHNNGTITFDGGTATLACNNVSFNFIVFNHTANAKTINSDCALPLGNNPTIARQITLNGTLTGTGILNMPVGPNRFNAGSVLSGFSGITGGSFYVEGGTIDLSGYTTFSSNGTVTVTAGLLKLPNGSNLDGALTINGGTFNAPSGTMTLAGNATLSGLGVFNHNNGSLVLDGTNQAINGAFTFKNLTKNVSASATLTLPSSTTQTIQGTLTLKGTAGNLLSLRSSVSGTQYSINPAMVDIAYLDVQDSNNIGPSVIQAAGKNITNRGNNTRWNFDNPSITNVGPIYLTNGSNIANNKPAYTFTITDPQASDTVKYQIQIDNNSDFSSPEIDYTSVVGAQGARTFTVGQAVGSGTYTTGSENQTLADAAYYVRIKGIDSTSGDGGYSTINGTSPAFTVDTTKPTGSVIFGYKTDSTSRDIYLILTASDNLSGVDKMMISENSNFANATFEEYKTSKAYTVSDGYGTKNIYVKFRDKAGNESTTYIVIPNYSQVVVTPSTTPGITQVPVSYGVPIGGNLTDGLSVLALRVIGRNNNPLSNVSINIPSLGINTTTDENGLIVLQNVPLGSYYVLGLFNNKEFNQNLDVSGDQSVITIKLEDTPNTLTIILTVTVLILLLVIILGGFLIYRNKSKNKK